MGETNLKKPLMALVAVVLLVGGVMFVGTFTMGLSEDAGTSTQAPNGMQQSDGLGVESGSVSVDSDDAQGDARELKGVLDRFGGEVKRETMEVRTGSVTHKLEVLVERSQSVEFVDWVQENHDVTRADVVYETASGGGSGGGTAMSSVKVTFHEEREASLVPNEFTSDLRAEVGGSLESVSGNAAKLAAVPFEVVSILLVILRLVAYVAATGVPLFLIYVATQRLLRFDVADI